MKEGGQQQRELRHPGKSGPGREGQARLQAGYVSRADPGKEIQRHGEEEDPVHHYGRTRPGRRPVRQGNEDRQRDLPGTHLADVRAEPAVHPAPDLFRHRGAEGFVELRVVALEFEAPGKSLHAAARDEHPAAPAATEDRNPRELEVDGTQRLAAPRTGKAPGLAPGEPQGGALLLLRRRGGIGHGPGVLFGGQPPLRQLADLAGVEPGRPAGAAPVDLHLPGRHGAHRGDLAVRAIHGDQYTGVPWAREPAEGDRRVGGVRALPQRDRVGTVRAVGPTRDGRGPVPGVPPAPLHALLRRRHGRGAPLRALSPGRSRSTASTGFPGTRSTPSNCAARRCSCGRRGT